MNQSSDPKKLAEKIRRFGPPPSTHAAAGAATEGAGGLERMPAGAGSEAADLVSRVVEKALNGDEQNFSKQEQRALEAIVEREYRPVSFVINGSFEDLPYPWEDFNSGSLRSNVDGALSAVGRVELISPAGNSTIHLGTGFIVGDGLMMTNRHVAEIFVQGVGSKLGTIVLTTSRKSAFNFGREKDFDQWDVASSLRVTGVKMIHPYWDMALLELKGVPSTVKPLKLSVTAPEDLVGRKVMLIGYSGRGQYTDPEAIELERQLFGGIYGVKRVAPGEIDGSRNVESFGKIVDAMIHDVSTLQGNSGSAILDVESGEIISLHFMGAPFVANYSVPLHALASDPRVVDMGLNFTAKISATNLWDRWWSMADGGESLFSSKPVTVPAGRAPSKPAAPAQPVYTATPAFVANADTASVTIPLTLTISVGGGTVGGGGAPLVVIPGVSGGTRAVLGELAVEGLKLPVMYDGMDERGGYDPGFLGSAADLRVPLPEITEAGEKILARQKESGEAELKYHHFSVFMHAERRLALFTAANVDWRMDRRLVNGRKPTRSELSEIPDGYQEQWLPDERISAEHQLPDVFFTRDRKAFDKGHLVRRDDVTWGQDFEDIQMANGDTYYTTNCSPQVSHFNQASLGEFNWGDLESMVERETKSEKVMIFSGPVLTKTDRIFYGAGDDGPVKVKIPRRFWKIIVARTPAGLKTFGFIPRQDLSKVDFGLEFALPEDWQQHQVSISTIEDALRGLVKLDWFKQRDAFAV